MPLSRFGDLVHLNTSRLADPLAAGIEQFVGLEHIEPENLHIRSWGNVADGTTFTNHFKPGQVLFGKRRAYQRKVAVAEFEGVCSSDIYVFESKDPNVLLPELLPFICQSEGFYQFAVTTSAGSLSPRTSWTHLANYEFPLPPLDEQRRIADLLWAADDTISSYCDLLNATHEFAKSRLSSFIKSFTQKKYIRKVKDLLTDEPKNGYSPNANDSGKGYRTVSISAISDGKFVPGGNIKYADVDYQKISASLVQKDDVFVVRGNGNRYLAGKCGIASESFKDLFYPDLLIRLRFDGSIILPAFATIQWNDPFVHRDFISRAKSTNGIWKVNGQDVRKHTIVVPPLDEQEKFLAEFEMHSNVIKNLEDCREQVSTIKRQMLNNYL